MKRVLYGVAMVGALTLPLGPASAEQYSQGSTYVEQRGGVHSPSSPSATGGAAGYYVRDGVAVEAEGMRYSNGQSPGRITNNDMTGQDVSPSTTGVTGMTHVDIVHTPKSNVFMGVGGGGLVSDNGSSSDKIKQGATSQADLGASVGLSKSVSLRAVGRYQRQSEFSDKTTDNLGANIGLKISF